MGEQAARFEKGSNHRTVKARLMVIASYLVLGVLSAIWGLAFVAIRFLEPMLTPVNLTLLRWFLASAAFLVLVPFIGKMNVPFEKRDLPRFLLVAFATVVSYHLTLNYSENSISAALAVLIVSLGPVFIVVLSRIFLGEKHGPRIIIAVLLAFAGAAILSLGTEYTTGNSTIPGIIEATGTALSYSVFAVFSKPLVHKYGPRPVTAWAGIAGTLMLLPLLSGNFFVQVESLPLAGWIAILYLSILSTVIGYILFYTLISRGGVGKLSIQLYMIPIVGVAGGVLLLGESLTVFTLIGGTLMLVSVGIATMKSRRNTDSQTQ